MGSELASLITTWGPIIGSVVVNAITIIYGYAKLGSQVDRLAEKIAEKDADIGKLEERIGFRMTEMEARQAKLEDYMLKEIRYVLDIVQQVKADVKGVDGYLRAQADGNKTTRRR